MIRSSYENITPEELLLAREKSGLSIDELSEQLGISASTIRSAEKGKISKRTYNLYINFFNNDSAQDEQQDEQAETRSDLCELDNIIEEFSYNSDEHNSEDIDLNIEQLAWLNVIDAKCGLLNEKLTQLDSALDY